MYLAITKTGKRKGNQMKRILLAALLSCLSNTQAGTIYVDKPIAIPVQGDLPCFIEFAGVNINVAFIESINTNPRSHQVWQSSNVVPDPDTLQVVLVSGRTHDVAINSADKRKATEQLKRQISACRSNARKGE